MMKKNSIQVFIIIVVSLILVPYSLNAEKYIILADQSGSLIKNDPEDFRKDALKFFLGELRADDRVALLSFGDNVREFKKNGQSFLICNDNLDFLYNSISSLTRNDGITDLRLGLKKVLNSIGYSPNNEKIKLLLFTDAQLKTGDIPYGVDLRSYLEGIYQLGAQLRNRNIVIYGLAFTRNANLDYLQRLASITGGDAIHAYSPEVANQAILKLVNPIIEGPFKKGEKIPVAVTDEIKSFTIYAFNDRLSATLPQIEIFNPDGEKVRTSIVNKYKTSISAEVNNPKPGIWSAYVEGASGVKIYYSKKVNYDLRIYSPRSTDLSVCSGSQLPINFDINNISVDMINKCDAIALLWDAGKTRKLKTVNLDRDGYNFSGKLALDNPPGIYNLGILIRLPNETIRRNYIVNIEKCVDFQSSIETDIVLGNSAIVRAEAPDKIDNYQMNVILYYPNKETREFKLFDNGDSKNGDALANDGIYSNILDGLNKPGIYDVDIIMEYSSNGIPVIQRNTYSFYKMVSIKPSSIEYKYPRKNDWQFENNIDVNNKTSYDIIINNIMIEDYGIPIDININDSPVIVKGNSISPLTISYQYSAKERLNKDLKYSVKCIGSAGNLQEPVIVTIEHQLTQKASLAEKLLWLFFTLIALFVLLLLLGIFIMTPIRFSKKFVYTQDGSKAFLSGYEKQNYRTAVYIPENDSIYGISLLGWGKWYRKQGKSILMGREEAEIFIKNL